MAASRADPLSTAEPREDSAGFSIIEVIITGAILAIGACALIATLVNAMTLASVNHETSEANQAARQIVERLHGVPLKDVFRSFNADPSDDPQGFDTAPGTTFQVGSSTGSGSRENLTGHVVMPLDSNGRLRESTTDPGLGMPRDLNGDGAVDVADHSADYVLLPVRIRVTWRGVTGTRVVETSTVLGGS